MAEETAKSSEASKDALDLNSLSGLDFGPDWADGKSSGPRSKHMEERGGKKGKGKRPAPPSSRDRRSGARPNRGPSDYGQDRRGRGQDKRETGRRDAKPNFQPTVKVDLYPQDEAFDALVKRLRTSARTYQLFEIAQLLLEKPERYVVVVTPQQKHQNKDDPKPLLYYSVPGHLPFETEEQAINYVLKEHIDLFFEVEEIEVDPPSGNFQIINRCGITGELLGPPNYHRYQEFLQRHCASRISGMSFERFQSKVEGSKEQEDIDAWLESMRKGARYTVKDRQENEPESFESLEAARHFLITHRKDKVVGSGESVRFAGRDIERMPRGNIRRSVEQHVEQQKHFPLDSANNIRGRLRRHKFAVYKKGSKGVSYVCAVKRKFRDSKTVFTDSIRDLIDFIEKHPEIPASKLSKEYIGIDTEKQKPESLEMKEAPEQAASSQAEADAEAPSEQTAAEAPVEQTKATEAETPPPEAKPVENEAPPPETKSAESEAGENSDTVPPEAKEASTEATPKSTLSKEEQAKLNQLMLDLRWLITEGYVTEYGDGRLFAPAPLPEPSKKNKKEPAEADAKKPEPQIKEAEAPADIRPTSKEEENSQTKDETAAKPPESAEAKKPDSATDREDFKAKPDQ